MIAQPLFQGIADADIPLHRQIMLQLALGIQHRRDVDIHQIQAAVAALINQLAAPRLALKQGLPHLLVDFSRRLAAGQQARVLIEQLRQRISALAAKRRVGVDNIRPGVGEGNGYRCLFDHRKK